MIGLETVEHNLLLGALLVIAGAAWLMPALGLIATGGFLLAIDRRIS